MHDVAAKVASGFRSEAPDTDRRFPRSHRLTARRQYVEVYERGWKARRPCGVVFALPNDVGVCRLGLTVTRRVGSAVRRNRVKRVLREIFRRNRKELPEAMDIVVNGHSSILTLAPERVERELLSAIAELARKMRR